MNGWIGVDLDGTLAHYSGWKDGQIGEPIPAMLNRVKGWLASGLEVRIFTARVGWADAAVVAEQTELIENWCEKHLGQKLKVTATKDFEMIELWDDRAVSVQMNTGDAVCYWADSNIVRYRGDMAEII